MTAPPGFNPWLDLLEQADGDLAAIDPGAAAAAMLEIITAGANPERLLAEARVAWSVAQGDETPRPATRGLTRLVRSIPDPLGPAPARRLLDRITETRAVMRQLLLQLDALAAPLDDWITGDPATASDELEALDLIDERSFLEGKIAEAAAPALAELERLIALL
jgi:hypothetical protein